MYAALVLGMVLTAAPAPSVAVMPIRADGVPEFAPRHGLDSAGLSDLFAWTEQEFNDRLAGNPIRRIGHERWLRNIAVALGNAPDSGGTRDALASRADHPSALVREHVGWAMRQGMSSKDGA